MKKAMIYVILGQRFPAQYFLPVGAIVTVEDGAGVKVGETLARIPQETSKTRILPVVCLELLTYSRRVN